MWMIKGSVHDNAVEVPCIEIERLATRGQVLMAAQGLFQSPGAGTPLSTLAHEIAAKDPLPGIDGIESWGARAFDLFSGTQLDSSLEFRPMIPTSEGSHINGLTFKHGDEVEAEAFHWPEAIVANVSGLDELIIESPDGPVFVPEYLYPTRTGMTKRSFFEWRAYLGAGTLIVEGESEFEEIPADPKGRWIARVPLLRSVGVLIGRIVHWMGRDAKPSRDPSFGARLKHFERIHPDIAARYPDLRSLKSAPGVFADRPNPKPTLIFVHGTLSCAIPNLALLDPLTVQTFRFEHDTFQSISTNAKELIAAVRKLPKSNPLYLVAHSRGGLVARLAARELTEDYRVIVRTYGTPHLGTPLANVGGRLLNTLLAMGRTAVGGIFSWDPASLVVKTLLRPRTLPEGLDVMRTDSETLKSWRFGREAFELITYGGAYDRRTLADGVCAYALGETTHEAFGQQANDLVVPTSSACGAGDRRPVLETCDHFHYFSIPYLRAELQSLYLGDSS